MQVKDFYPAKLTFKYKWHRQTVISMRELKKYYFHKPFLGNLLKDKLTDTQHD